LGNVGCIKKFDKPHFHNIQSNETFLRTHMDQKLEKLKNHEDLVHFSKYHIEIKEALSKEQLE
jgi:hypothetical protein